ncbi:hypothetical protein NAMH_1663 [Nautilia profundicola AmH]|uniref:Nucleotidyltransferase family protein n=1 Tax=Nautilia profundicola (strain ATCC BAA-1463 / DSM 18972 / AmH) TaxID=598659 RepID=B9L6Q5_NAUPA|nr:hypothetical protein [Nautilia profundicola]ACM92803.1 hypothetical protein NAMH_1663 [Nautilia profundicola AmH]
MYIDSKEIIRIFKKLNDSNLKYILIRNINNELPNKLKIGKDIDILIHKKDEKKFVNFFKENGYDSIPHPFRNDIFLYGIDKFEFKYNNNNNILFDLNFQLVCRSLNKGEWIPLDQEIQKSAWENKRFEKVNEEFGYWTLGYNDEFLTLIVRSIFDKREFQEGYINRIEELKEKINLKNIERKMKLVFFKFTPYLLDMIEKKDYKNIIKNYIQFKEY